MRAARDEHVEAGGRSTAPPTPNDVPRDARPELSLIGIRTTAWWAGTQDEWEVLLDWSRRYSRSRGARIQPADPRRRPGGGWNSGRRSSGLSRTCHGVAWIRVWCARQSSTRLSRLVSPPSAQCWRWWASQASGLALAAGEPAVLVAEDECFPDRGGDEALGAADVEDLAEGAEHGGDHLGVTGQPPHGRDREVVAGVQRRGAEPFPELVERHRDGEPWLGAVLLRQQPLGLLGLQAGLDQGVPGAGAVVAQVAAGLAAVRVGPRQRRGQRVEGGLDDRGVLDRAPATHADAAEAVVGDGEEPAQVRRPLQPVQRGLLGAGGAVGVEHLEQVVAGLAQLGGVQRGGLVEQHPLRLVTDRRVDREPVDHADDHLGVLGRDVARR